MSALTEDAARELLCAHGQGQVLRGWDALSGGERSSLLSQIDGIDFSLMDRLVAQCVHGQPEADHFDTIVPVPVIGLDDGSRCAAYEVGEEVLRSGRVGLFLVAGGQGTRLGYEGPKGAYPIGPVSGKSLFAYHAEKIHNLERRYGCVLPWYIMVSESNEAATRAFFHAQEHFGLDSGNIVFVRQRMVPCVDESGRFLLERRDRIAMNPNGHGGCLPAMVEGGVMADARARGVDTLSYFQVDNWAVKVADPLFIGYHVMRAGEMSSKCHRRNDPREAVGVHCLCDGAYRVIEYTELDIYPQLVTVDASGGPVYYAGNPAIHILSVDFVERMYEAYEGFPWHCSHKAIPYVDEAGETVHPERPNGYKFETFVFDALRFVRHAPIALEIERAGEYTPTKQFTGVNSVEASRASMAAHWGDWLDAAGSPVARTASGAVSIQLEVSPQFALTQEEFVSKSAGRRWPTSGDLAIGPDGETGGTAGTTF